MRESTHEQEESYRKGLGMVEILFLQSEDLIFQLDDHIKADAGRKDETWNS